MLLLVLHREQGDESDQSRPNLRLPFTGTHRPKSMEMPLCIALGISPLCLLLKTALIEKKTSKKAVFSVSLR
jgi:hypothetical protein